MDKISKIDRRTVIQYDARWNLFLKKYKDKRLVESLPLIVSELFDSVENLKIKHSTFRLYRASICFGLASIYLKVENDNIEEAELDSGLSLQLIANLYIKLIVYKIPSGIKETKVEKTSATKKKSFPKDFYNFLKNNIENNNSDSRTTDLWAFVKANLIVGLRPIEWLNARVAYSIESREMVLLVKNAKNSNGRANGDERTLRLLGISQEDEFAIHKFFQIFHKKLRVMALDLLSQQKKFQEGHEFNNIKQDHVFGHIWDDYEPSVMRSKPISEFCSILGIPQAGLAEIYLRSLQREMHKFYNQFLDEQPSNEQKRVTLYSTRHQCIANAKSSKVNIYEIAAFFGHSSKETSSRHYGKAWSGWSVFKFRPSLESILAVHDSHEYLKQTYGYNENVVIRTPDNLIINNDIDYDY